MRAWTAVHSDCEALQWPEQCVGDAILHAKNWEGVACG